MLIHGHATNKERSREYYSWRNMRDRCNNPGATGYKFYGGKGISVCKEWDEFTKFLKDMGPRPNGH